MNHHDIELLSACLDGEAAENDRRAVETHARECEPCRVSLENLRSVKDALAKRLELPPAPHHLRLHVESMLAGRDSARARRRWLAAGAAALTVGAALWLWLDRSAEPPLSLAMLTEDHAEHASKEHPWEISSSDEAAFAAWMEARLAAPAPLPALEGGAKLLGGRFCRSFPKPTVQAFYAVGGRRASLFIIRDDAGEMARLAASPGAATCWKDGVFYVLMNGETPSTTDLCKTL